MMLDKLDFECQDHVERSKKVK